MGFKKKAGKKPRKRNRHTKSILTFDEKARTEFLTGFRKRKNERRKKAQLEIEQQIREERKELRRKKKELLVKQIKHQYVAPELEDLAAAEVKEMANQRVTITDISDIDLAGQGGLRLGQNTASTADEDGMSSNSDTEEISSTVQSRPKSTREIKRLDLQLKMKERKLKPPSSHGRSHGRGRKHRMKSKKERHKMKRR